MGIAVAVFFQIGSDSTGKYGLCQEVVQHSQDTGTLKDSKPNPRGFSQGSLDEESSAVGTASLLYPSL